MMLRGVLIWVRKVCNVCYNIGRHCVYVGQYTTNRNYGDALGLLLPKLLEINNGHILPKRLVFSRQYRSGVNLQMIGSTLGDVDAHSVVCGIGAVAEGQRVQAAPLQIVSVRGPLTRNLLLAQGIDCPAVYGDPAMLLPLFYTPKSKSKKYKIGLIPHYVDKGTEAVVRLCANSEVHLIDILLPPNRGLRMSVDKYWKQWIDELCNCEYIISSSLHGLILAEAYKIPTLWAVFSNNINGGDFKFMDYYSSININYPPRMNFQNKQNLSMCDLIQHCSLKDTSVIDKEQYKQLLQSISI